MLSSNKADTLSTKDIHYYTSVSIWERKSDKRWLGILNRLSQLTVEGISSVLLGEHITTNINATMRDVLCMWNKARLGMIDPGRKILPINYDSSLDSVYAELSPVFQQISRPGLLSIVVIGDENAFIITLHGNFDGSANTAYLAQLPLTTKSPKKDQYYVSFFDCSPPEGGWTQATHPTGFYRASERKPSTNVVSTKTGYHST